jgi:DNA-binding response OmpR family regulator
MTDATVRVIIIDPDPAFRAALGRLFSRYFDARVSEAADGVTGLELIRAELPDLVMLDVSTARFDGIDTLRQIRELPGGADLPVVALSATNDDGQIVRVFRLGVADYLLKPLNVQLARERLERVCAALRAARQKTDADSDDSAGHVA